MKRRVVELFHHLVDLSPTERIHYLEKYSIDPAALSEVEQLLAFDSTDSAPWYRDISFAMNSLRWLDATGLCCGPYRLVSIIGRGGMGVVYLAEREDGEVTQRAAVKLLQPWLRQTQRQRFLQEREILAGLTHPNIAHLLDAGHLEDDQPYLVMEYIDGKPIDAFATGLSVREKIKLILKVCAAVSYLHRNLIVHRDLKPSNILITHDGEPKVLDFGIAKVLDVTNDPTVTSMRMLTPNFASPEQVVGDKIGTPSDIYSLGAVLYHLLTGETPNGPSDSEGPVSGSPQQAITPPRFWTPDLAVDLEIILMKALRKEPHERYATVEQLADDLQAFLDSRPIRARKDDLLYRARKLIRRNWLPFAAAALTMSGLTAGFVIANRERSIAQQRFDDVRRLSNRLFDIDKQVLALPGSSKTRQLIVDTSLEYLRRLTTNMRADPGLMLDIGSAYMRVGRVQGVPISPNLGQPDNAEQNLRVAETMIRSVAEARPTDRIAYLRMAQVLHDRMVLAQIRRPNDEALPLGHSSEEWLEKYLRTGAVDKAEEKQVVIVGMNVATWYVHKGQVDGGLRLLRRMVGIAKTTNQPAQVGSAQTIIARALRGRGDLEGALIAIREGVVTLGALSNDSSPGRLLALGLALGTQGEILGEDNAVNLGRLQEAIECFERAYVIASELAKQDASDAFSRLSLSGKGLRLAGILRHSEPLRALGIYEEVLRRLGEIPNNSRARREEVRALVWSTYPMRQIGRFDDARKTLDEAMSRLGKLKLYPAEQVELGSEADDALRAFAEHEGGMRRLQSGIEAYRELERKIMASGPKPKSDLADAKSLSNLYAGLIGLYRRAGDTDSAMAVEARRLEIWRHWDHELPGNSFIQRQLSWENPARRQCSR